MESREDLRVRAAKAESRSNTFCMAAQAEANYADHMKAQRNILANAIKRELDSIVYVSARSQPVEGWAERLSDAFDAVMGVR